MVMIAKKAILVDAKGNLVDEAGPDGAFQLVAEGQEIPQHVLDKYGDKLGAKSAKPSPPETPKDASEKVLTRQTKIVKPTRTKTKRR
jgi:hypothetical protein